MPFGVPVGVVLALSTRFFLEPDLGVILLLRKVDTGVEKSSLGVVIISERGARRDNGVETAGCVEPATRGVKGCLPAALAEALRVGMRGLEGFCFSWGAMFALPLVPVNGGCPFCARIMALWSRDWRGGRCEEGLSGCARVGVAVAVAFVGAVIVVLLFPLWLFSWFLFLFLFKGV